MATSQTSSQVTAFAVVSLVPDDVIVSPFIAILTSGQTQQFVASLVGDSNPAVTWSLSPAENTGILSGSGLYTAPSLGSSAPPVAVTVAANQQGGAAVGSALVCVFALAPSTAIAVTPAMTKTALGPNQTQQFSAQLIGSESEFTWSILPAGLGSINSSGLYKAPASISEPGSVVVVATSTITSVLFGTAVVLLN